jgi:integrase
VATIRQKHHRFDAKVRIPKALHDQYGGRQWEEKRLQARDLRSAKVEAAAWEATLRLGWLEKAGQPLPGEALRELYQRVWKDAVAGDFQLDVDGPDVETPELEGIAYEIEKIADAVGPEGEPDQAQQARLFALQDARKALLGKKVKPRPDMEPAFSEVADAFVKWWKAQPGLKDSNTENQKRATFRLFSGFWNDRLLRDVREKDAAAFMDALRHMDPCYSRSPEAREMSWSALQRTYGGRDKGMTPATLNRHAAALKTLWNWAARRGHCEGLNPFDGHRQRLKRGVNVNGYVGWTPDELKQLLTPAPKRRDLHEVMVVAMHSGMRLNEIAALTWADVQQREGIHFFRVTDAKTAAGNREVPVHPTLSWLLERTKGKPTERVWATFNEEGPGKKPGADASREFSHFKTKRGFGADRTKTFHSFRKNAVGQWEALGVAQTEVAEVVGHEKAGITFSVYGAGISLQRKAEIIALLNYPKLPLGL